MYKAQKISTRNPQLHVLDSLHLPPHHITATMVSFFYSLWLSFFAGAFAMDHFRPLPFGTPLPLRTLAPLSHGPESLEQFLRDHKESSEDEPIDVADGKAALKVLDEVSDQPNSNNDPLEQSNNDETLQRSSRYLTYDSSHNTAIIGAELQKRVPSFRGSMQMDCAKAREACQNACWYQNCVRGANGNASHVTYTNGAKNVGAENRVQAGTKTSRGTPCNAWPFGQRFWDTYPMPVWHCQARNMPLTPSDGRTESRRKRWYYAKSPGRSTFADRRMANGKL